MQEDRAGFSPCLFGGVIYLAGYTNTTPSMEAFSPDTDTMLSFLWALPQSSDMCVYVGEDLLVVHTSQYTVKYAAGQAGQLVKRSEEGPRNIIGRSSNTQPMVDKTKRTVYVISGDCCNSLNMDSGDAIECYHS